MVSPVRLEEAEVSVDERMSIQSLTFFSNDRWRMTPLHLRAIRTDMGLNMVAMASLVESQISGSVSRNKYRSWEKPRTPEDWPFIPKHIAEVVQELYKDFHDFVDTLVSLYDGESPLVLIHRNDMFDEADLPLPKGITVENYNQAVGRAWGRIISQGYTPELVYFSTDPEDAAVPSPAPSTPSSESTRSIVSLDPVQNTTLRYVGPEEIPNPIQFRSFVNWDNGVVGPPQE